MKKRDVLKGFFLFLTLVDMAVIFWFSSQTGQQSGEAGNTLTLNLLNIFYPNFNGLDEASKQQALQTASYLLRISAHFGEFLLLGLFSASFANSYDWSKKKLYSSTLIFCAAYAVIDEIYQLFIPGRAFEVFDIVADVAGAAVGLLIFIFISNILKNSRRKKSEQH